jgi:hypothetical protein
MKSFGELTYDGEGEKQKMLYRSGIGSGMLISHFSYLSGHDQVTSYLFCLTFLLSLFFSFLLYLCLLASILFLHVHISHSLFTSLNCLFDWLERKKQFRSEMCCMYMLYISTTLTLSYEFCWDWNINSYIKSYIALW